MADLASALNKMNDIEIAADAPVSEATMSKMGANLNGLIDENAEKDSLLALAEGVAAKGSVSTSSGLKTVLSFTVTLAANDFVALKLTGNNSSFTEGSFTATSGTNARLYWKRGATTLQTLTGGTTISASGTYVDKPGAGTYTYTLESGDGVVTAGWSGAAFMHKVKA